MSRAQPEAVRRGSETTAERGSWIDEGLRVLTLVAVCLMMLLGFSILTMIALKGGVREVSVTELRDDPAFAFLLTTLPMLLALFVFPLAWESWVNRRSASDLLMRSPSTPLARMLTIACALLAFSGTVNAWHSIDGLFPLVHLVTIALSEEFLVRSVVQERLARVLHPVWAVLITAAAFAFLLHSGRPFIQNLGIRMPLGVALGFLTYGSRTIWPAVFLHFTYNLEAIFGGSIG